MKCWPFLWTTNKFKISSIFNLQRIIASNLYYTPSTCWSVGLMARIRNTYQDFMCFDKWQQCACKSKSRHLLNYRCHHALLTNPFNYKPPASPLGRINRHSARSISSTWVPHMSKCVVLASFPSSAYSPCVAVIFPICPSVGWNCFCVYVTLSVSFSLSSSLSLSTICLGFPKREPDPLSWTYKAVYSYINMSHLERKKS